MAEATDQQVRELAAKIDRLWDHIDEEFGKLRNLMRNQ